jgi:death-on-curing protein
LARPRQRATYDTEVSVFGLAASYSYGLARNHPFVDGNKRIALTIAAVFLELNGWSLDASEAEAVVVYQRLAAGAISEEELAKWMQATCIPNA